MQITNITPMKSALFNGALAYRDRTGLFIPTGSTGIDAKVYYHLPTFNLPAGEVVSGTLDFVTSTDFDAESPLGLQVSGRYRGNATIVGATSTLAKTSATTWRVNFSYKLLGNEECLVITLFVKNTASTRTTDATLYLSKAVLLPDSDDYTRRAEIFKRMHIPPVVNYVSSTINAAMAALDRGDSADEPRSLRVAPGIYTGEGPVGSVIDMQPDTRLVHYGPEDDCFIRSLIADETPNQDQIQPIKVHDVNASFRGLKVVLKNGRYPFHLEGGGVYLGQAIINIEDCDIEHLGADGWGSPTAIGIGQDPGQQIHLRRNKLYSTVGALGFHDNVDWHLPALLTAEGCHFAGDTYAVSVNCIGSGVQSIGQFRGCSVNGQVRMTTSNRASVRLDNQPANRYGYKLVFDDCSPFDWTSACSVDALELQSVAGASSSIGYPSGTAALPLFGIAPKIRNGGVGLAARIHSYHAVSMIAGETDPGVTLAARLGDCSSANLTLTIDIDGVTKNITLDADYSAMSNSEVVTSLNSALATAYGGDAGGRAFALSRPYENRAPIFQPSRERIVRNNDSTAILKGHALAWSGAGVRLMTSSDAVDLFAGIALDDAVAGARVRFQGTGRIHQVHLLFDGSPSIATRDRFEVGATPGTLIEGSTRPIIRSLASVASGWTMEVIGRGSRG